MARNEVNVYKVARRRYLAGPPSDEITIVASIEAHAVNLYIADVYGRNIPVTHLYGSTYRVEAPRPMPYRGSRVEYIQAELVSSGHAFFS